MKRNFESYEEISMYRKRPGNCPVCGKRTIKHKKFWQTVNPYNRINGRPKTWEEVYKSVQEEANNWVPDFRHDKCK